MSKPVIGRASLLTASLLTMSMVVVAPAHPAAAGGAVSPEDARPSAPPVLADAGKGDADGDRVADDLEVAVGGLRPGERVDVMVQGLRPAGARAAAPSLRVEHDFRLVQGFSGSVNAGQVRALARVPGVTFIELDGMTGVLDAAGERDYGVRAARAATPSLDLDGALDGSGVGICVVDTGIDPDHEQISGRIDGWRDFVDDRTTPYDDHGHGTHVSSIAAGDGTGANATAADSYGGVARAARLYGAKVLDSTGYGADSDVVLGIEWCAAQPGVDVISMSLGSPGGDGSDAASVASAEAVANGVVVVAAAGNDGDGLTTITAPGVSSAVITVGAASDHSVPAGQPGHDPGLVLAGFSSRGPTVDGRTKPDVTAPGLTVVAADAGTTSGYVSFSGTSMATPFVAGVVALGLDAVPAASPAQVKSALHQSAVDAGPVGPDNDWGWGLVDARAFIDALKGTSPVTHAVFPAHQLLESSVATNGTTDVPIVVTRSGEPLGVSLLIDGTARCVLDLGPWGCFGYEFSPDLDAALINPSGQQVAMSRCPLESTNGNCAALGRSETLGVASAAAGTWTLRIQPDSGSPNDGQGGEFTVDVFGAIGSAPTNAAPDALDDAAVTLEDTGVTTDVLGNDSDVDGDPLAVASFTQGAHGSVAVVPGGLRYTPAGDWFGDDSFSYTVSDGRGGVDTAEVSVTVTGVNDAPVARDDQGAGAGGSSITLPVLVNDSDADGDPLSVVAVGTAAHGSVSYAATSVTYTADAGFSGTDAFVYTVGDGKGGFDTAVVSVTVDTSNTQPTVVIVDPDGVDDGAATVLLPPGKSRVKVTLSAVPSPNPAEPGDTYTYRWRRGAKVLAATGPTMSERRRAGTYRYTVTLDDGRGFTASDTITITVR